MPSRISLSRILVAGGAATVLGASAIGLAAAQTSPTPTPGPVAATPGRQAGAPFRQYHQQVLDAAAANLGVTPERLRQAIEEARQQVGPPPKFQGGPAAALGGPIRHALRVGLQEAAAAIGITPEQLRQELRGSTLAQVATAHGKQPSAVAAQLKAEGAARIDQAVAEGKLPADRAAMLKQRLDEAVDRLMTRTMPAAGERPAQLGRQA